jgi:lysophospholipase L1-like esterase
MLMLTPSLPRSVVLLCLLATHSIAIHAAEPPAGMVDEPCPAPIAPSPRLRDKLAALFFEPRTLTAEDFRRLLSDASMIQFNEENQRRAKLDWPGLCRYRADNAGVLSGSTRPRIVFMGDSITENWALADTTLFANGIVNRGISGQTTAQMLVRFRADVIALRPEKVHILGGTNDIAGNAGPTSAQDFKNQIMSMVDLAQANGIAVILGSIPPAASFPWRAQVKPMPIIRSLNTWLRGYAASKNIEYVDYHAALSGPSGELKSDLGNDGVHPNRKGYAVMRQLIDAKLSAAKR